MRVGGVKEGWGRDESAMGVKEGWGRPQAILYTYIMLIYYFITTILL